MKMRRCIFWNRSLLSILYAGMFVLFVFSCTPSPLEQALRASGKNRAELEKVLDYFSKPEDSLKLKAALFLIENMPGHYTLVGDQLTVYNQWLDSVGKNIAVNQKMYFKLVPLMLPYIADRLEKKEDIENMTSDFLIKYITQTFEDRNNMPWVRELDFTDFCEYVLPYRISHEAPVLPADIRDSVMKEELQILQFYQNIKYYPASVKKALKSAGNPEEYVHFPLLYGGEKIQNKIDCFGIVYNGLCYYRLYRVPTALDYVPCFPHQNNAHGWIATVDHRYANHNVTDYQNERVAKVYRKTFSHQPAPNPENGEYVPPFFQTPFDKDVTPLYTSTSDIQIKLNRRSSFRHQYAYLTVFNELEWKPVAFGKIKNRKVIFQQMGRDVVYLPVVYQNQTPVPADFPVLLRMNGSAHSLIPDTAQKERITLSRKFPTNHNLLWSDRSFVGRRIEASNDSTFRYRDTIHTIHSLSFMNVVQVKVHTDKPYRYWRMVRAGKTRMCLAGLAFYGKDSADRLSDRMICDSMTANVLPVFDDDPLTYATITDWVGMDFKRPVQVSEIRYLGRNDANNIFPGNVYELFYLGMDGWTSLGRQEATTCSLVYKNVPGNALLWLRNINEGREERIFTWENGEVRFW